MNNLSVATAKKTIALVGNPNVGKSLIFTHLTGKYARVSNYPGTTVVISGGKAKFDPNNIDIFDTPGINSLIPMSEDEQVSRDLLFEKEPSVIVQVADAKNLKSALFITAQLAELKIPTVLCLNMWDEATDERLDIDTNKLSSILGVPCIPTVAVTKNGMLELIGSLKKANIPKINVKYQSEIEGYISKLSSIIKNERNKRLVSLMLLSDDTTIVDKVKNLSAKAKAEIDAIINDSKRRLPCPASYLINQAIQKSSDQIVKHVVKKQSSTKNKILEILGKATMHKVTGVFFLAIVLVAMWYFVGILAAGDAVKFFEGTLFGEHINPFITNILRHINPIDFINRLFVGEYGLITVGFTYAFAIIFPIVIAFFLFFGFLEDSGYIPRLAIMSNKACRLIGLNGKSVLPLVLGLGCDTMATVTTRVLSTKKERTIVIILLSLTIPCSAKLGVIMGMSGSPLTKIGLIWFLTVLFTILAVGYVSSRIIPGTRSDFVQEVPPLRIPNVKNIIMKTFTRLIWYLKEAVPLFIIGTAILFVLHEIGALAVIIDLLYPIVGGFLGLPKEAAPCIIMGFLRRDYGAAGFSIMFKNGQLTGNQVLISLVVITFLIPCIAQVLITAKEKGIKTAILISTFSICYAFVLGGAFNLFFKLSGIKL